MSPMSSSVIPLITTLFLYNCFHSVSASNCLIHQTCKNCSETDPNINYRFCIASLQSDPRSISAKSLRELGLLSINITRRNVTDTRNQIKKLLKKYSSNRFIKGCLDDCLEVYSDAIPILGEAGRDYKAKRYADSNIKVSSVLDASTTCEDGFKERVGIASPLTKRNNDTSQLSAIALSIIDMLNQEVKGFRCLSPRTPS